jgi:hypothetical protein
MVTKTIVITITAQDVLYVGQQITRDLTKIGDAYPNLINGDKILKLFQAITTFLIRNTVQKIGFSIHDPEQENLVYHEWIYVVLQGDAIPENMRGKQQGKGGEEPVVPVSKLPQSARFQAWVIWSDEFLKLSDEQQKEVLDDTGWGAPGNNPFKRTHKDFTSLSVDGYYVSGQLGVELQTYRNDFD